MKITKLICGIILLLSMVSCQEEEAYLNRDLCLYVTCLPNETCINGICTDTTIIDLCANVFCDENQQCIDGNCIEIPLTGYAASNTAIVINEGNFNTSNGSISFIAANKSVTNNIFNSANSVFLGDVVTDYTSLGNKGIIVVNNSQKVELVNAENFKSIATFTQNLNYPRYALGISDNKAYVSNGSATGTVVVLDLENETISKVISVGNGPEEMLLKNGNVYVANSGGFGVDSTISIINSATNQVVNTITVGDIPVSMVEDKNGKIWVLCKGQSDFSNWPNITKSSPAKLVRISSTNTVDKEIEIISKGAAGDVARLSISADGQTIYYTKNGNVFKQNIDATSVESTAFIDGGTSGFYGLDVNPITGNIWAATNGFTTNQSIKIYNSNGILQNTLSVGIGTNGVYFNE